MAELASPQNRHGAENRTERADDLGIAFTIAPTWFDPAETPGLITLYMFLYAMHDALVKPMHEGPMTPCLATQWSESADGLAYDFALRQGVKFHNGDPLTAEDVQFSFERYKGASAKETKQRVKEVEIVNPHHVRFKLHEPWPDFMTFYGSPATGAGWIVPKNYTEKVGSEKFKEQPVGLGPYRFVSHQAGVELVMEAHADYWRKVPHVKRLVFKGVPEATTRLAMLKQQEADVAYGLLGALGEEVRLVAPLPTARGRSRGSRTPRLMPGTSNRWWSATAQNVRRCCTRFSRNCTTTRALSQFGNTPPCVPQDHE